MIELQDPTRTGLYAAAALCAAVAVLAGWKQARRGRRRDVDAVGWVDWTTVQMLALFALAAAALLAWKG